MTHATLLEERQGLPGFFGGLPHLAHEFYDTAFSDRIVPDANSFAKSKKMRGSVEPHAVPRFHIHGVQHRSGRAFAVGACYVDRRKRGFGMSETFEHRLEALETKIHPLSRFERV
jgi:hypothetical protein